MTNTHKISSTDVGLLVLRLGIGIMFMRFGYGKITGGPEQWVKLGGAMGALGIAFAPTFWGFLAAVSEFFGGLLLMLGVFVRPAAFLMAGTMFVATTMLVKNGAELQKYSHALDMCIVFVAILIMGGGRLALASLLPGKWGKRFA